jgi:hypothetical protein
MESYNNNKNLRKTVIIGSFKYWDIIQDWIFNVETIDDCIKAIEYFKG